MAHASTNDPDPQPSPPVGKLRRTIGPLGISIEAWTGTSWLPLKVLSVYEHWMDPMAGPGHLIIDLRVEAMEVDLENPPAPQVEAMPETAQQRAARMALELVAGAAAGALQDLGEMKRFHPPSKRGSTYTKHLDSLESRLNAIEKEAREALDNVR